jgi:hypothetical protein
MGSKIGHSFRHHGVERRLEPATARVCEAAETLDQPLSTDAPREESLPDRSIQSIGLERTLGCIEKRS